MTIKNLFDLSGRKAIITGGSRGLGLQIAEALGEQGAQIVLAARKQNELDEAVAHLDKLGVKAHAMSVDLSKPELVTDFAKAAIAKLGHVDILINNAGEIGRASCRERVLNLV